MSSSESEKYIPSKGDLVKYTVSLFPVDNESNDCSLWLQKIGIIINVNNNIKTLTVLSGGEIYTVSITSVRKIR